MAKRYADDEQLVPFRVASFKGGYNSYTASKSNIQDDEIPVGQNAELDDNGSISKTSGKAAYGPEIASGKAVTGLGWLRNLSNNKVVAASGTSWYYVTPSSKSALTGFSFTDGADTDFAQAVDRLYGANGYDNLKYTTDGAAVTDQANGKTGRWPTAYNQRLYMTETAQPDRVWYSNPYSIDLSTNPASFSASNFGTFDTNLSATPKKNAGFIQLLPGSGVEISRIFADGDYLYAYTRSHGVWKIGTVGAANADGSISHTVSQIITSGGALSGRSVLKNQNDQWFYDDGYFSLGEVATYQSPRQSTKSGRIRSELRSVSTTGKTKVAGQYFKEKVYIAYSTGTYNDRIVKYDDRINAWSAPVTGINASCFLEYSGDDGVTRLLAASSNPSDSFIYEIETGTNYSGSPVSSFFETKSFDCGKPGLVKRYGFVDVFYSLVAGRLSYQVYTDETTLIATDAVQIGTSATATSGIGSLAVGSFAVGAEFTAGTSGTVQTNGTFRIDCGYSAGKRVSVRFSNSNLSEQYKIDSLMVYYLPGSIYEQL